MEPTELSQHTSDVIDQFLDFVQVDLDFELFDFAPDSSDGILDPLEPLHRESELFSEVLVNNAERSASVNLGENDDISFPNAEYRDPAIQVLVDSPTQCTDAGSGIAKSLLGVNLEVASKQDLEQSNSENNVTKSTTRRRRTTRCSGRAPSKEALRKKRWRDTLTNDRREMIKKREREQKRRRFHKLNEEGRAEHRRRDRLRKARERIMENPTQKAERLRRERQRKAAIRARKKQEAVADGHEEDYNTCTGDAHGAGELSQAINMDVELLAVQSTLTSADREASEGSISNLSNTAAWRTEVCESELVNEMFSNADRNLLKDS